MLDEEAQGTSIPATKAGFVKPSVVFDAIDVGIIRSPTSRAREALDLPDDAEDERIERIAGILKPKREEQALDFHRYRLLFERASYIRLDRSRFVVTGSGRESLDDPVSTYRYLLEMVFARFDWRRLFRFVVLPTMRDWAGFLWYALHRLCGGNDAARAGAYEWTTLALLTDALVAAIPPLREVLTRPPVGDTIGARSLLEPQVNASFIRFLGVMFGLIEYDDADPSDVTLPENGGTAEAANEAPTGTDHHEAVRRLTRTGAPRIRPTKLFTSVFRT